MTPAEAVHYLMDEARRDEDLWAVLTGVQSLAEGDIYAWAEAEPEKVVALAESWQGVVEQDLTDDRLHRLLPRPDEP
jgi:hypothetical protein